MSLDARGKSLPFVSKKGFGTKTIQTEVPDLTQALRSGQVCCCILSSVFFGSAIYLHLGNKDIKAFMCAFGSYL